jgi:membrane protease YdiL (CAAX protease family)
MNAEQQTSPTTTVPWTLRDVVLGVAFLGVWWLGFLALAVVVALLELSVNPGLLIGLAELMLLAPVWWLGVRKYRVRWEALGLRVFSPNALGIGCGLMVLSAGFNFCYGLFLALFELEAQPDLVPVFTELSSPWWLLVAGVLVAPVVEDVFFRGFVFAGLRQRYGWRIAALLSAALFALVHLQPLAVVPIFILGYIFAYLYQRSHSIWPAIVMHVSTNALGLGLAYLATKL